MLYTRDRWIEQGDRVDTVGASYDWGWVDLTRFDDKEGQVMADTPLLVNIKGCGYAPDINCGSFANKYQALLFLPNFGILCNDEFSFAGPL